MLADKRSTWGPPFGAKRRRELPTAFTQATSGHPRPHQDPPLRILRPGQRCRR